MIEKIYLNYDHIEPIKEINLNGSINETIANINNIISSMKIKLETTRILIEEMDRILIKDKL